MHSYSLTEICDRQSEVFQQAAIEPVIVLSEAQSSYVILSEQRYRELVGQISTLEDLVLNRVTKTVLKNSSLLGSTKMTKELQRWVDLVSAQADEENAEADHPEPDHPEPDHPEPDHPELNNPETDRLKAENSGD